MKIDVSKTDYNTLLVLIDKCTAIIQNGSYTLRDYNAARRLRLIKKKIERKNIQKD